MTLSADTQSTFPGELVTLYQVDCSIFAEGIFLYFTPTAYSTLPVIWNGNIYTPVDIETEGFEYNAKGAFPTPTVRLSNVSLFASSLVVAYNDLIGAKFTRVRTFRQYLDNGPTPDPLQIFAPDVYVIEQKTQQNKHMIEWKLAASVDQDGVNLPSFTLVRDYCDRLYRVWDPVNAVFRYEAATCPYAGATMFDLNNNVTANPLLDACPKTLEACKTRFGFNGVALPFKGCPGLGRTR